MVMEEKRVITCTADNVAQVRAVVQHWPKLHVLVKSLQAGGCFPGLRGLQFTLTGPASFTEQGLAALLPKTATVGQEAAEEGACE